MTSNFSYFLQLYRYLWKMEGINNDSEGHYAQKDFEGTSDDCTPLQNQLLTATSNEAPASRCGTSTEDLSPAPSEDRSPVLTPNTAQDCINENLEGAAHREETFLAEDANKRHDLDNTQDSICWKLKNAENVTQDTETVTEDSSLARSEQSSDIQHHTQGILKRRTINCFHVCSLQCDALYLDRYIPMFWRNMLTASTQFILKWWQDVFRKCWYISTKLHCFLYWKTVTMGRSPMDDGNNSGQS
jgi:hypothetical protein